MNFGSLTVCDLTEIAQTHIWMCLCGISLSSDCWECCNIGLWWGEHIRVIVYVPHWSGLGFVNMHINVHVWACFCAFFVLLSMCSLCLLSRLVVHLCEWMPLSSSFTPSWFPICLAFSSFNVTRGSQRWSSYVVVLVFLCVAVIQNKLQCWGTVCVCVYMCTYMHQGGAT